MIKQNSKVEKLISLLKNYSGFISAKEIAENLNLSEKTIYRLVKEVNQNYYPDVLIMNKKGSGYKLNHTLLLEESSIISLDKDERQRRLLKILERLLLISPRSLNIYDLSQELFVSEAVILKDKLEIQKQISPYNLKVSVQSGFMAIFGAEFDIRRAIAELVPAFSIIDIDNLPNIISSEVIDISLAHFVLNEIKKIEAELEAELSYPYNINIFSHIYIMMDRVSKGMARNNQSIVAFSELTDKDLVDVSRRIIEDIQNYLNMSINQIEISYLYQYLHASRFQQKKIENVIHFSERVESVTLFYLKEMGIASDNRVIGTPIFTNLASHISPMLRRFDSKIRIKNNLLEEIQIRYPEIYEKTQMVSEKMAKKFGFSFVSEDEIGFLTLYFIRYLELHKSKIQAVIMCSSGIGISELLKMKIEKTFDSINVLEVVSTKTVDEVLESRNDIQLLITSVNLPIKTEIKTVLVSALMTPEDVKTIEQVIQEIRYEE